MPPEIRPHPMVLEAQQAYQAALIRAGASGVPGHRQPSGMSRRLARGMNNALESLGGRVPPERALQLVALTIPLRMPGAAETLRFEPSPTVVDLCR